MSAHSGSLLLLLILSADLAFILLHTVNATPLLSSDLFDLAAAGGHAKTYHLIKLFWVIVLLAHVLRATRHSGYLSWILVVLFLFLDDAFQLHQVIGRSIAQNFAAVQFPYLSLQPRHFGEWAIFAIMAAFLSAVVALAYWRGTRTFKKVSIDLLLLMMAFVFFGVVVDLAAAMRLGPVIEFVLGTVEDGGEMVVVSLLLWYCFCLATRDGNPDFFLRDLLARPSRRGA